jgi:hypothetical protein
MTAHCNECLTAKEIEAKVDNCKLNPKLCKKLGIGNLCLEQWDSSQCYRPECPNVPGPHGKGSLCLTRY